MLRMLLILALTVYSLSSHAISTRQRCTNLLKEAGQALAQKFEKLRFHLRDPNSKEGAIKNLRYLIKTRGGTSLTSQSLELLQSLDHFTFHPILGFRGYKTLGPFELSIVISVRGEIFATGGIKNTPNGFPHFSLIEFMDSLKAGDFRIEESKLIRNPDDWDVSFFFRPNGNWNSAFTSIRAIENFFIEYLEKEQSSAGDTL